MTDLEKKAFKKCVDAAFLAMDELRAVLMKARDAEDPMEFDELVLKKHDAAGDELRRVMLALGFDDDDEDGDEDEGGDE